MINRTFVRLLQTYSAPRPSSLAAAAVRQQPEIAPLIDEVPQSFTMERVQPSATPFSFVDNNKITFIFGEASCGQRKDGTQLAPSLVVDDGFLDVVRQQGWEADIVRVEEADMEEPNTASKKGPVKCLRPLSVAATCQMIADAGHAATRENSFPVMVGGDHSLSMGSVLAAAKRYPDLKVIWVDTHADINTVHTSPTGSMHGMPVAALLGLDGMKSAPGFERGQFACLKPENVAYIGLRDVDDGEKETMERLGMWATYDMKDVQRYGMAGVTRMALDIINPSRDAPLHVSFDVDSMDPADAPATGTAVYDGIRLHEALEFVRTVRETGLLVSLDLVEVNPLLGTPRDVEITVENARWVMATALGRAPPEATHLTTRG